MPQDYDADILREQANKLYERAAKIVGEAATSGAIIGALMGLGLAVCIGVGNYVSDLVNGGFFRLLFTSRGLSDVFGRVFPPALLAAAIFGFLGFVIGKYSAKDKAFQYRLEAQQLLVWVQIEQNTRRPTPSQPQRHEEPTPEPDPAPRESVQIVATPKPKKPKVEIGKYAP